MGRFKPTPALVTAFEARRLPRAYLVLLESLLNVNPLARPSCERVLSAIREGRVRPFRLFFLLRWIAAMCLCRQLDPVPPHIGREANSLIPIARKPSPDTPGSRTSNAVSRSLSGERKNRVENHTMDEKSDTAISPLLEQRTPLLRLLAPRASVDRTGNISVWIPSAIDELGMTKVWIPRST
jgi:hypothetical protein